ncbi:MAG: potassium channel family protein [Ginsengibacter sp.]
MKRSSPFVARLSVLGLIMLTGIMGYIIIGRYSFIDALYMTVITLATIGYEEVHPLSEAGKIFTIIFIISSFAVFAYIISSLTRDIVSGEMALYFKNRKLMNAIEKFSNHVIICGFGRHGQQAAEILQGNKMDFVVVDTKESHMINWVAENKNLVYIHGDATDDEILIKAGIKKAKALLLTLPADADNVFIVLSAKSINPKLNIISRAQLKSSMGKLKTAGADHVILPELIGGVYMAALISKPDVVELINNLWGDETESINIESVSYEDLPQEIRDTSIAEIIQWYHAGVNCLGIKDESGKFIINPPAKTIIRPKMKMMLFGSMQQMAQLKVRLP